MTQGTTRWRTVWQLWEPQRDTIASQIIQLLEGAGFNNQTIGLQQALQLWSQANQLLNAAH
jgi:hypothetical protein